ncbi:hypothetical protein LC612_34060 [Nostoc sp. CHAB 5834]|nr:hypothetical protein [Nostoc sp. CHAB 5834]
MKVFIHSAVAGETRQKLEELLEDMDCEIVDELEEIQVELLEEEPLEDVDQLQEEEQPVCVVVLTPGLTEKELQPELTGAVARGCRVVGIWSEEADEDASALADYGSDTVIWDRDRVRDAICGKPQHQAPDGTDAKKSKTDHGGC